MINWLKSVYQTFKISLTLLIVNSVKNNTDQDALVKDRLAQRGFKWDEKKAVNVFAIFSVYNWEKELLNGLSLFGPVEHFNWDPTKDFFKKVDDWHSYRKDLNNELIGRFNEFYSADVNTLVFLYASDFTITQETMAYLRRVNTCIVSFCWDDLLYYSGRIKSQTIGIKGLASESDINLTMAPEAIPIYNYFGNPCYFWKSELIVNESGFTSLKISDEFYVLFIGSKYGRREKFINKIISSGVKVKCFGNGWGNAYLNDEEMVEEIKKAPLVLGFSNVGYTKSITIIKGRDFEVPLCGGLYLTQYSSGLRLFYEEDEVLSYKNFNECLRKIEFVKDNPDLAFKIRVSGYNKAKRTSTWQSRFVYLNKLIDRLK